jgi:hypothetical protein
MAPNQQKATQIGFLGLSGVGGEQARKLRVPNHFRVDDTLGTVSNQYADGVAVIEFPTGMYTYRMFQLFVTSSAAVVGKTFEFMGVHHVNTANLAEYIEKVTVEIDGKAEIEYYTDELVDLNKLLNWDTTNGMLSYCFGAPGLFKDDVAEDAYLLGTANLRSVRLLLKLKAAWAGTFKLNCAAEYSPVLRPIGWLTTTRRTRYQFAAAGEVTITDLPTGIDYGAIWLRSIGGKKFTRLRLEVDQQTVFEGTPLALRNLSQLWGKDIGALPAADVYLDFFREMDAGKGLAALSQMAQVRRNAQLRLSLTLTEAASEFYAITHHCGPYLMQR